MENSEEIISEIELNNLLLENENNSSKTKDTINLINKQKIKSIFLDDNLINKIFFIWNIKSTYFEKEKTIQEYNFIYYPLINEINKDKPSPKFFYFSFFFFF